MYIHCGGYHTIYILAVQLEMLLNLNCLGRAPARGFLAGTQSQRTPLKLTNCRKIYAAQSFGCIPTLLGPSWVPSTGLARHYLVYSVH